MSPKTTSKLLSALLVALALGGAEVRTQAGGPALEKDILVEVEECLDARCEKSAPMNLEQMLLLETTLWNRGRRQGLVVLRSRYRPPNIISFGDFAFDEVAFGPTRPTERLYAVDRLTFWPVGKSPYVVRRRPSRYVVRVPRRETTFLLELRSDARASNASLGESQPELSVVPEVFGLPMGVFGLFETKGLNVTWNGRRVIAFPNLRPGRSYQLRLQSGGRVFQAGQGQRLSGMRWSGPYEVPTVGVVKR